MKKIVKISVACAMVMGVGSVSAQAADGVSILSDAKVNTQLRPRVQYTDHSAATGDAGFTLTNRTNINVNASLLEVDGLRTTIELNSVNDFGTKDKTTIAGNVAAEATVAKVTQANLTYGIGDAIAVAGRLTTNLDNQRFIGSVGWKQNFQTLDLAGILSRGNALEYTVAYVTGVNAIADDGSDTNRVYYGGGITSGQTSSVAANASYKISGAAKVTGYAYMLGSHSDTYGVAVSGKVAPISYRVEYATQTDASLETSNLGKPTRESTYMNIDLGANLDGILLGVNYEVLGAGGDATSTTGSAAGFQTPLATKHKFNGWADKFLVTPANGLVDTNVMVGYKAAGFGVVKAVYHTFASDENDISYGSELDLLYKTKITSLKNVTGMIKAAMFTEDDAGAAGGDTTKIWLMADYKFSI